MCVSPRVVVKKGHNF
uniref:Uncharacterized protein n=1 Tax=Anguilla anguilla TaxID=7936 RepID=A0A0E9QMD8_ANGAN